MVELSLIKNIFRNYITKLMAIAISDFHEAEGYPSAS